MLPGNKPLREPKLTETYAPYGVTMPQRVNDYITSDGSFSVRFCFSQQSSFVADCVPRKCTLLTRLKCLHQPRTNISTSEHTVAGMIQAPMMTKLGQTSAAYMYTGPEQAYHIENSDWSIKSSL